METRTARNLMYTSGALTGISIIGLVYQNQTIKKISIPNQELITQGKDLEDKIKQSQVNFERTRNDFDAKKLEYKEFVKNNPDYQVTITICNAEIKKQEIIESQKNKYMIASIAFASFGLLCAGTYIVQKD